MHHHISAQRDGGLQSGGAKTVVNSQYSARFASNLCQSRDVTDLGQRIGRCFSKQQSGVGLNGFGPFGQIGLRHKSGLDAKLGKLCAE